ncbi:competence protein CoiA family protein [Viridibacillus arvi]|uniref:competence protein CoiA family protein n=1 Tax=Viridibacillus arvi TaxID=263475 RepID=UPI003D009E26
MREARHKNDEKIYLIPQNLSESEVENHKQIAKKGTFTCPYCEARLIVKSGDILGNCFSHLYGEGANLPNKVRHVTENMKSKRKTIHYDIHKF